VKNECLNAWKGIAAFFVVFIHCQFPSPIGGMMNGLARFAVPLFFLVSGYFCYEKEIHTVKKRIRNTWRLFLLGNGVYFLWKLICLWTEGMLTFSAVGSLFSQEAWMLWVCFNQSPFMGHLWFLGALLYGYLFYALLVHKGWEERVYWLIPLCLAGNLLLGELLPVLGYQVSFLYTRNFWLMGLPFFLWGHWFARQEKKGKLQVQSLVCMAGIGVGACLSMGEMLLTGGGELYMGSTLMAGSIFMLAIRNPHWGRGSLLAHIGEKDSLHIYLWQMLLLAFAEQWTDRTGGKESLLYGWLMPLFICFSAWLLAVVIRKGKLQMDRMFHSSP